MKTVTHCTSTDRPPGTTVELPNKIDRHSITAVGLPTSTVGHPTKNTWSPHQKVEHSSVTALFPIKNYI